MPWDTNIDWSDTSGETFEDIAFQLVEAINERCLACRIPLLEARWYGTTPTKPANNSFNYPTPLLAGVNDLEGAIYGKINDLMALYANHNQATGDDFSGIATIPAWNETDMLAQIGDPERYEPSDLPSNPQFPNYHQGGCISKEWVYQQYKMINQLRWVRNECGTTIQQGTPQFDVERNFAIMSDNNPNYNTLNFRESREVDWPTTLANWPSAWFTGQGNNDVAYYYSEYTTNFFPQYSIQQARGRMLEYATNLDTRNHESDLYFRLQDFSNPNYYWVFDGFGLTTDPNTWARFVKGPSVQTDYGWWDWRPELELLPAPDEPPVIIYVAAAYGIPQADYGPGLITSVTILFDDGLGPYDPGLFNDTGFVDLYNFATDDYEIFPYTAVAGTGSTRTFTVNYTLLFSYPAIDTGAGAYSSPTREPGGYEVYSRGYIIGDIAYVAANQFPPITMNILRFDVVGGFEYNDWN